MTLAPDVTSALQKSTDPEITSCHQPTAEALYLYMNALDY